MSTPKSAGMDVKIFSEKQIKFWLVSHTKLLYGSRRLGKSNMDYLLYFMVSPHPCYPPMLIKNIFSLHIIKNIVYVLHDIFNANNI